MLFAEGTRSNTITAAPQPRALKNVARFADYHRFTTSNSCAQAGPHCHLQSSTFPPQPCGQTRPPIREHTHWSSGVFFFFFFSSWKLLWLLPTESSSVSLHHPSIDFAGEPSSGQPHSTRNVSTQRWSSLSWGNTTMVKWRRESSCCTSTQHTAIVAASSHILTLSWFFVEPSNVSWGQPGCWWSVCVASRRRWEWPTSQHALPWRVTDL